MTMEKRKKETFTGEKWCAKSAEMMDRQHNLKVREVQTPSYQLSGQEKVLLPCHHHTNTFSLLSATQHGHKFLLTATSHVYSIHLRKREKMITARRLLHQVGK